MLRKVVLLGLLGLASVSALPHNKADVARETSTARMQAHEAALQSEKQIDALNNAVFPAEPAAKPWAHQTSSQMEAHYKGLSDSAFGFDPTAKKHAVAHPIAHPVAQKAKAVAQKQQAAAKAAPKAAPKAAAAKKAAPPPKPTARQEAAAEEKRHAALSGEVWGKQTKDVAWKHQGSAAELARIAKVTAATTPVDRRRAGGYKETAKQEEARHTKEVDASFPASWFASKKVVAAKDEGKKAKGGKVADKKEKAAAKPEVKQEHLKHNLAQTEQQTSRERSAADKSANGELAGIAKLSAEVFHFGHNYHKKAPTTVAAQKHAEHKAAMHKAVHDKVVHAK
eukprot:CAMPEP_0173392772 /NCGR_PEP_ID=MMETSP1356-20130122/21137_1 /TAXON_ID=77927 ORGANISM="Hemiselmis virescens, Strain PCC157" /NCGR_SAMPLE_ID=MMETSP1356 /ASSEMBLY_ACC=CAM_ASM_000847 /LENGTH=338 /DNA_ID=CAMNT_0014350673 /DNA_START=6 /DNA_END=1022 /DNA_ORIENTATION=-